MAFVGAREVGLGAGRQPRAIQTTARIALFPDGLLFTPARTQDNARSIWKISGTANFGSLVEGNPPERMATPTGFEPVLPA